MTKENMVAYLKTELADLERKYDETIKEYNAEIEPDNYFNTLISKDKAKDKYYHFWMVCNDLGIVKSE